MRFVSQAVLFKVKSSPVFFNSVPGRRLITHNKPIFLAILAPSSCAMHRTIIARCQIDVMPKACFPQCQRETLGLTRLLPTTLDPQAACQANPPMPLASPQVSQQMRLCQTSVGHKDHPALVWQP